MHLGHFLFHYPQPGGTTTAVRGLSRALAGLGHRVTIYCCGHGGGTAGDTAGGIRIVHYDDDGRNPLKIPRPMESRIARNEDSVDLLILHGMFNPRNNAAARAIKRAGVPYIVCPQGAYYPDLLRKHRLRKRVYATLFERPLLNGAAAVQVFAEDQVRLLADFGVRSPGFVVPNGFDPAEIGDCARRNGSENLRADAPKLLYIGRLDMYTKGLDLLLRALAEGIRLRRLPAGTKLDMVGLDWGDRGKIAGMVARLGLQPNVTIRDAVEAGRRWCTIASYDLTVLPSRHECFSFVVLESMIMAKPVLVSRNIGLSGTVQRARCGYVVEPTVEAITAGLAEAIDSRAEWPDLGARGRQAAFAGFTWDRVAGEAVRDYERLLPENRNRGNPICLSNAR